MKVFKAIILLLMLALLSGCISNEVIEGAIDKSGKAVGTVILASSAKSLADTRKIKAKTNSRFGKDVMVLIGEQPIEVQAELISQSIQAKVNVANNNTFKGMLIATAIWAIFLLILRIAVFLFNRYRPLKEEVIKKYQKT